jgi:hypothetical protein
MADLGGGRLVVPAADDVCRTCDRRDRGDGRISGRSKRPVGGRGGAAPVMRRTYTSGPIRWRRCRRQCRRRPLRRAAGIGRCADTSWAPPATLTGPGPRRRPVTSDGPRRARRPVQVPHPRPWRPVHQHVRRDLHRRWHRRDQGPAAPPTGQRARRAVGQNTTKRTHPTGCSSSANDIFAMSWPSMSGITTSVGRTGRWTCHRPAHRPPSSILPSSGGYGEDRSSAG